MEAKGPAAGPAPPATGETKQEEGGEASGEAPAAPAPAYEEPVVMAVTVADTVLLGRDLRMQHKSVFRDPLDKIRSLPKPARPKRCELCDAKSAATRAAAAELRKKRGARAAAAAAAARSSGGGGPHAHTRGGFRCLHKFQTGCSERLAYIAKPHQRRVLGLLEDHAQRLTPHRIDRLMDIVNEEVHFGPAQAYDYFVHVRKANKMSAKLRRVKQRKDRQDMFQDKKFTWARDATVVFARGIQKRLLLPATYDLRGGMLRLSNTILDELCCYMRIRRPARCNPCARPRFMIDLADKVTAWIDQILIDSDERIAVMDIDADPDIVEGERCEENDIMAAAGKTNVLFESLHANIYDNTSLYYPSTENVSIPEVEKPTQYKKKKEIVLTYQDMNRACFPYEQQWYKESDALEQVLLHRTSPACSTVSLSSTDSKFSGYASDISDDNVAEALKMSASFRSRDIAKKSRGLSLPCLLMLKEVNIHFTEPSTSQYTLTSLSKLAPVKSSPDSQYSSMSPRQSSCSWKLAQVESSEDSQYFSISPRQSSCSLDWCFARSNVSIVAPKSLYGGGNAPRLEILPVLDVTKSFKMTRSSESCVSTPELKQCGAKTALVTADQVTEWNSLMLSLLQNLQSWCLWIQGSIERVTHLNNSDSTSDEWKALIICITREAQQWRQYNIYSEQIMWRVGARYKDKKIVRAFTVATKTGGVECRDMLKIIDMLEKWTNWLTNIVQETSTIDEINCADFSQNSSYQQAMWSCFKRKVEQNAEHWRKYNMHMMQLWQENRFHVDYKIKLRSLK